MANFLNVRVYTIKQTTMGVKIRYKKGKNGYSTAYLDIHFKGNRRYEYLNVRLKDKPSNALEKLEKKEKEDLIKRIALQKETDILTNQFTLEKIHDTSINFFDFFEQYILEHQEYKDVRVYTSTLKNLRKFLGRKSLYCYELNDSLFERFAHYLEKNFNGSTPASYFKKLRKVVKEAVRLKYLLTDCTAQIQIKKGHSTEKDVLNYAELKLLSTTDCPNKKVKSAFLLSCFTGLRYCDVKALQWKHVKANRIEIIQQKTKVSVEVNLNEDAIKLLGEYKNINDFVFLLPSHTGCAKILRNWVAKAQIDKHITWHCGRHTFGTNLITHGVDLLTTSKLLGHTSLKYTTLYTRFSDKLGREGINKLPNIL